jgi:hypothetical protein
MKKFQNLRESLLARLVSKGVKHTTPRSSSTLMIKQREKDALPEKKK